MNKMQAPKNKVIRSPEFKEVVYDVRRWELLKKLRSEALRIMESLIRCGFKPVIHGSLARGDVDSGSDIDIVIPYIVQPYEVEVCLERSNIRPLDKYVIQAIPSSTPKAYIELDAKGLKNLSFPLTHLSPREYEFYRFGGLITYEDLIKDVRVPGVTKQLILIMPTDFGHKELPVVGYEGYVSKVLGISLETVKERVEVLTRRDFVGRTGVYLSYMLRVDEDFSEALRNLIKSGKLKL